MAETTQNLGKKLDSALWGQWCRMKFALKYLSKFEVELKTTLESETWAQGWSPDEKKDVTKSLDCRFKEVLGGAWEFS